MTDPLAELEAADEMRTTSDVFEFDVMVSRAATALALAHDDTDQDDVPRASHYEAGSYRALVAAHVPALLARLRAAEAQGDKLAEAVDTFRFAYMGQLGHVVIPDALAEMEDAAREWRALRS